jgi:hydrogenase nickel incorporation protein HypA/HybF
MHEWALAEAVIEAAIEESRKGGLATVTEILVKVGDLQQMEPEIFQFALEEIAKEYSGGDNVLKHARIILEPEPAIFRCRVCGHEWEFKAANLREEEGEAVHFAPEVAHAYLRCPQCKSPDFEVIQGRGVTIQTIKGTK